MSKDRQVFRRSGLSIPLLMILTLVLTLIPTLNSAGAEKALSVSNCKFGDPFNYNVGLGFPKNKDRLSSTGNLKVLLVAIDYPDATSTENATEVLTKAFDTKKVNDFYQSVSYGKVSLSFDIYPSIVRMSKTSSNYVGNITDTYPKPIFVSTILQEATKQIAGDVVFSNYQAVVIFDLGKIKDWGYWGFAIPDSYPGYFTKSGYVKNSLIIGYEYGLKNPAFGFKTAVLLHELGHLFGFVDLYIIAPGNYFIGQTPGPFDVMNSTSGAANEFLAWQRWLQGWVPDSNVTCLDFTDPTSTQLISPLGKATTKNQMVVIKVNNQKALVLESRRGTISDNISGNEGLLAYEIDLSLPTLQGPIKIIPRATDLTMAALSPKIGDNERYIEATAKTGEYIRYKDILIENLLGNTDGESIKIYKGNAATTRQSELDLAIYKVKSNEYNLISQAKASGTYYESPICVARTSKFTFQILNAKNVWEDFASQSGSTRDGSCFLMTETKPYVIATVPSRTFYRTKIEDPSWQNPYIGQIFLSNLTGASAKVQAELELSLAKQNGDYYEDNSSCSASGVTGTVQIERNGNFEDYAPVTGWVESASCASTNKLRPYVIARFASGTKFRFKFQASGWDKDYFSNPITSGLSTIDQLLEARNSILKLQSDLAAQKSSLESVNGELITAKSKLEGDVVLLKEQNTTLQEKVNSLSKTTITCLKGTTQKKVTGVKPVCPAGYKKKA